MRRQGIFWLALLATAAVGCATPKNLSFYAVDAITGHPVAGVRVEHAGKKSTEAAGVTDDAGRLNNVKVVRGDKVAFTHPEYQPLRVFIDFSEALPLQPSPPEVGDKAAQKADVPVPDADPFPYASDHSVTILLRPK